MTEKIAYLCDRQKCPRCSPECMHTTDIRHAYLFKLQDGTDDTWFEEPNMQRAHWEEYYSSDDLKKEHPHYRCTRCGAGIHDDIDIVEWCCTFRYCPDCGAKMW